MTQPAQRAGIYCRMSLAAMGDTTKVDDQERICRDLAGRLAWPVADVYSDNSKSAWRRDRKRPAWDRMLADVDAGRIGAIIVYHGDRLVRQPFDLEVLINLAYGKGVQLASPTGMRDLGNPDDLYILRIETAGQCRESDNISRRRKAQYVRWAREGRTRPGGKGGRAFGFATDGATHIEAEAAAIEEMARRILAGETRYSIGQDLTARGLRTPSGLPVTSATVDYVLRRPKTAGLMPDGESRAAWEPVLDRETWERVLLVLAAAREGFGYATNVRRWLLSSIAVCGACGARLTIGYARRNIARGLEAVPGYGCHAEGCRKVTRNARHLEAYVSARVIARLANPLSPAGRPPSQDHAAEWAILSRERDDTDALLADYQSSAGRARSLMARLDQIDARMAELRARDAGDSRARLLEQYAGTTREEWEKLGLDVRRALISACYRVVVLPSSGRGPGFRTEDVRLEPQG